MAFSLCLIGVAECLLGFYRLYRNEPAGPAAVDEIDPPGNLGVEGIVFAAANVQAWLVPCPRWRTMMAPPVTIWPAKILTPRRWAFESRPFLELPKPFLCAIA